MIAEASFIRTEGPEAAWRNAAGPEGLGQGQWEAPRVPAAQLCSHLDGCAGRPAWLHSWEVATGAREQL